MNTLLLDQNTWDLLVDLNGNIAMASGPYAIAQDVASAVRLFAGELWYDTSQGVPYFDVVGKTPDLQFLKSQIEIVALTVPDVVQARCLFAALTNRVLSGQIQIIDVNGVKNNVNF